jgi:hypothetical protein
MSMSYWATLHYSSVKYLVLWQILSLLSVGLIIRPMNSLVHQVHQWVKLFV